jgi:hypothetical protein
LRHTRTAARYFSPPGFGRSRVAASATPTTTRGIFYYADIQLLTTISKLMIIEETGFEKYAESSAN